jgi:hypothetical protein
MGIERMQHAADRGRDELTVAHGIRVVDADVIENAGKGLELFVGGALLGLGRGDRRERQ